MTLPLQSVLEGKYEILEKIGEGGIGSVYKVRHRLLEEERVIKVLRSQAAAKDDVQQRFLHEARMAIKLKHPNIAQLYDFSVTDEGTAYIVMEFIDGIAVDAMLRASGPPSVGLTVEISRQALAALGYLHSHRFVHRDVSPDNLMLTRDYRGEPMVKLIDLGIAKNLEDGVGLTATGMFLGKVRYSSPEQFSAEGGSEELDHRSDIYSFGVMLYELLTDRYPFTGNTFSELAGGHLFKPPRSFDESDPEGRVPPGLRQVVLKALEKDPAMRFASTRELTRELEEFRVPKDSLREEWDRLYRRTTESRSQVGEVRKPGSTQDRLDRDFGLVTTPAPEPLHEVPPEPTSMGPSLGAIDRIVEKIEKLLAAGNLDAAEKALSRAVARHGRIDALDELRRRLRIARGPAAPPLRKPPSSARRTRWLVPVLLLALLAAGLAWKGDQLRQWLPPSVAQLLPAGDAAATGPDEPTPSPAAGEEDVGPTPGDGLEDAAVEEVAVPPPEEAEPVTPERFSITSLPAGATVYLAGERLQQVTPVEVDLLPGEPHRLRIELAGYESSGMEFTLEGLPAELRQSGALHFPLTAAIPPGTLVVRSTYPATIRVAGRGSDAAAGESRLDLPPGPYVVEVTAPSVFYRGRHPIDVRSGEETVIELPPTTQVAVAAAPSHCQVSIDGREVDFVPFTVDLTLGPHTFVFFWETLGQTQTIEKVITSETERVFAATEGG